MIFDLENITVKELYQTDQFRKYIKLQKMLKSKNMFCRKKARGFEQMQFGEVSTVKHSIAKPSYENMFEVFRLIFGVKKLQYENAKVVDYLYALNYVKAEITNLIKKENNMLGGDVDPLMEMAGVKRLNPFQELNTLIKLARDYSKTPKDVECWTYSTVFTLMLHGKIEGEVYKKYYELKRKQSKKK